MAKAIRTLRNHWKKTIFATGVLTYGYDFLNVEYKKTLLLRKYCHRAAKVGDVPLEISSPPRHIVVILNPAANYRKAKKEYENYCAPLLHLSGACVSLIVTSGESDAVELVKKIPEYADAIVIAGGDGTISEVITGLLRLKRDDKLQKLLPIGILPLGKTNSLAEQLYSSHISRSERLFRYYLMMEAAYSIISEVTKNMSTMEISNMELDNNEKKFKPVYAVSRVHAGPFRDAEAKKDKFWYFGKFRSYASFVFGWCDRNSPIKAELEYTPPCAGCTNCYQNRMDLRQSKKETIQKKWWHAFAPRFRQGQDSEVVLKNYESIKNAACQQRKEMLLNTTEISVVPEIIDHLPQLRIEIGPEKLSYFDFVKEGWLRIRNHGSFENQRKIYAQKLLMNPQLSSDNEAWLSIDKEEYEFKKVKIELLHNILQIFIPFTENIQKVE